MSIEIQGFRVVPLAIVLQVLLAFAVPLVAGYFPVSKGSKMTVRRAISEENPVEQTASGGLIERLGLDFPGARASPGYHGRCCCRFATPSGAKGG